MESNEVKLKFINLRLNSVSLKEITESLGISKSTAVRWNNKFSKEISNLKSQNELIAENKINSILDKYLEFFEKKFNVVEKVLEKSSFITNFEIGVDYSLKLFKVIQQLIAMKKLSGIKISTDDVNFSFLNSLENDEVDIDTNSALNETKMNPK